MVKVGNVVALGDTYSLVSGLMEIAYVNGPTVILQGPATYDVDSAASGFLHLGTLLVSMGVKPGEPPRPIFSVHVPRRDPNPNARQTFQTNEADFMVTVAKSGAVALSAKSYAMLASPASDSMPQERVLLPDAPVVSIDVDAKGVPRLIIIRREPPATVASEKRRRKKESGYVQKPKGKRAKRRRAGVLGGRSQLSGQRK